MKVRPIGLLLRTEHAGPEIKVLTCIYEVLGSNRGRNTAYPDRGYRGFPQSFLENVGILP
jgi:hypothetical protein